MKRITAFFFTIIYLGFLAGTVMNAGKGSFSFSDNLSKESGEDQAVAKKESAIYWDGYTTHLNKAIKHLSAIAKNKLPRTKSNFFAPTDFLIGDKVYNATQLVAPLSHFVSAAPLYIKNRVLRI